jgi:hypothetical protein
VLALGGAELVEVVPHIVLDLLVVHSVVVEELLVMGWTSIHGVQRESRLQYFAPEIDIVGLEQYVSVLR